MLADVPIVFVVFLVVCTLVGGGTIMHWLFGGDKKDNVLP